MKAVEQAKSLPGTVGEGLQQRGVSRREFLKFCTVITAMLSLPPSMASAMAEAISKARRQSVIWLSFQECTGCTESITRSHSPTLENLIFDLISLDYHHTLQAASGEAAEQARASAMKDNAGKYLLIVDGAIPMGNPGFSTIAGISNYDMLVEAAKGAAAIVAVGTCATYGGIPELDALGRPKSFYGETIHDRCYRRPFYDQGKFAQTFDDEAARQGWCLFKLGCKGPVTYNSCATTKWNDGTSFPIQSGHGCIGCSEPNFWDAGPLYKALSMPLSATSSMLGAAAVAGVAAGVAITWHNRSTKAAAKLAHEKVTVQELSRETK